MRLIDVDAIEKVLKEKHFNRVLDSDRWIIADIKKSIMDLPTIDAVPVIRCKDCRWFINKECVIYCLSSAYEETFCSYAEPKENHENI